MSCALSSCARQRNIWKEPGAESTMPITKAEVEKIMKAEPRRVSGINLFFQFPQDLQTVDEKTKQLLKRIGETCPVAQSIHPDIEVNIDWGEWS